MPITIDPDVVLPYLDSNTIDGSGRIISLNTLIEQWSSIEKELSQGQKIAVERSVEGVTTLWHIVTNIQYAPWFRSGRLKLITSSDAEPQIPNFNTEYFLSATLNSRESDLPLMYPDQSRPYTFLFTNRKIRPHRRYLILELQKQSLLDHALWSCLDDHNTQGHPDHTHIYANGTSMKVKKLDPGYDPEIHPLWIDGVIYPRQYQHTWFTLVSETAFEYPHSFRTEKIWKPILAGHPFLVCANAGFYRDLRNLGFRTFDHLLDESFDSIINGKDRLDRLITEVRWLCSQNLSQFWSEARSVCLYNHQRALELHTSLKSSFAQKLQDFMHA